MSDTFKAKVSELNVRLKARGIKCGVAIKDGTLHLQKTLPPKPGSQRDRPYQQRISTGLKGAVGLRIIERRAELLAAAVATNTFRWEDWGWEPRRKEPKTVGEWVAAFEEQWRRRGNRAEITWQRDYRDVFKHLPAHKQLTPDILIDRIDQTEPRTRTRDRNCVALAALARFAGLDVDLKIYKGYTRSQVEPRLLPEDEQILEWVDGIRHRGWQWTIAAIVTYGLRNHEIFRVRLDQFPILEVSQGTKTGWRYVVPLYPEWAERWDLSDRQLPPRAVLSPDCETGG
ncbi:MAG: site-specific recombinase, partial [Cyanobacteria bacterium J06648_11]